MIWLLCRSGYLNSGTYTCALSSAFTYWDITLDTLTWYHLTCIRFTKGSYWKCTSLLPLKHRNNGMLQSRQSPLLCDVHRLLWVTSLMVGTFSATQQVLAEDLHVGNKICPLTHEACCLCGCHSTNNYTSRNWNNSPQWREITEDYEKKIKEG